MLGSFLLYEAFAPFWLPLVILDPAPHVEMGTLLRAFGVVAAVQMTGHFAIQSLAFCGMFCPPYFGAFFWIPIAMLLHVGWGALNGWVMQVAMLHAWDDLVREDPKTNSPARNAPESTREDEEEEEAMEDYEE